MAVMRATSAAMPTPFLPTERRKEGLVFLPSLRRLRASAGGRASHALTLVEMVVSLSIISILMLAMGSSIMLVTKALPDRGASADATTGSQAAIDQLADELRYALHFTERSATAVGFLIADRDGDGGPEHLRYSWSGVDGAPLRRAYNHGAAQQVVPAVADLSFEYDTRTTTETYLGPLVEKPLTLLASHTSTSNQETFAVTSSYWYGQYLPPDDLALDPNTTNWRIGRVDIYARGNGGLLGLLEAIDIRVQLRTAENLIPTTDILADRRLYDSALLTSMEWRSVTYVDAPPVMAGQPVCLVLARYSSGTGANVLGDNAIGSANRVYTTSGDAGWTHSNQYALTYRLYGYPTVRYPDQSLTREHVTGVGVELTPAGVGAPRLHSRVQTVAAPQVLTAFWHTDFDAMPTATDSNGDTTADWATRSGGALSTGAVSDGKLKTTLTLDSRPLHDFTQPVTVDARFRSASAGVSTTFWINADWNSGVAAPIFATLRREGDGTQTLLVGRKISNSTSETLLTLPDLPGGFVDVRLLIDPSRDTFNVAVDGQEIETYQYTRFTLSDSTHRFASLVSQSGSEWERVTIRVGGTP